MLRSTCSVLRGGSTIFSSRSLARLASRPRAFSSQDWAALGREWVERDPNPETRLVIGDLVANKDLAGLEGVLGKRIAFGTAGLRGPMAAGNHCMNDLTVIQAAQGLCKYLEQQYGDAVKTKGVAVGYDHRAMGSLNSKQFARLTNAVFVSRGIPVYLLQCEEDNRFVPTPLVPCCVELKVRDSGL